MSPFVLVFSACLVACAQAARVPLFQAEDAAEHFERFIQEHDKQYASEEEKQAKFEVFKDNLEKANAMNKQSEHTTFGITRFMDLTVEEFVSLHTGLKADFNLTGSCSPVTDAQLPYVNVPESFDWREQNAVTRVKNQGSCGSCYAFSAAGAVEGQYAIKYGQLAEFSEQQTVDCDTASYGCSGGLMANAFSAMISMGGLESESDYPYDGQAMSCRFQASKAAVRLTGCNSYQLSSQERLKEIVATVGPISIAVQAKGFQYYKGGVMEDNLCNMGEVNHAILLVGYGTENGKPYWLAKNSWDTKFGENGYIKFPRGDNYHSCGVMNSGMASPIIALSSGWQKYRAVMSPIFVCFFGLAVWSAYTYDIEDAEYHFEEFIEKFGKEYENENEKQYRFKIFVENLKKVNELNKECDHGVHGITQFMDMDVEEFTAAYTGVRLDFESGCDYAPDDYIQGNDAPESFDWRDHGVVSSVKDQAACGSCYAFSAVGNIEGQYAMKYKEVVDLSPQQIVDCDYENSGCGGGLMSYAFRTIKKVGGIETEADYPYQQSESDSCQFDVSKVKAKLSDCVAFNLTSQEQLKQLLYKTGPIAIAIQATGLQTYTGGIFHDEDCDKGYINHGVLLVGYGVEKDQPFWIVKNSWGDKWGEKGYFRVVRGDNLNSCKMLNDAMCSAIVA
ncbi:uncharacterized protein LOC118273344 [Spodoptera frugiperda]|uniref:Uncharacterized protein LOC118273344 n=2 Tax=Spodoptera frugiperda TaxID=7108 RepID=A0A9R0EVL9_SPOFR|nr:uncharacterized protein LOC118273344 [Spodoptera frugiperda]